MIEIKAGGRMLPLTFTMDAWMSIEAEICSFYDIGGIFRRDEKGRLSADQIKKAISIIRIMANCGLEEKGEQPDVTDEWLSKTLKPGRFIEAQAAVMNEIADSMEFEQKPDPDAPRDLVLEELNKKK